MSEQVTKLCVNTNNQIVQYAYAPEERPNPAVADLAVDAAGLAEVAAGKNEKIRQMKRILISLQLANRPQ